MMHMPYARVVPEMVSLVTSGSRENVTEYCINVHVAGQATMESNNSASV